jgi:hypothetical protein
VAEPGAAAEPPSTRLVIAIASAAIAAVAIWMRWWPGSLAAARGWWRRDEPMYFQLACGFLHGRLDVHYFINPTLYAYVVAAAGAIIGGIRRLCGADASFALFLARETAAPHLLLWAGRVVSIVASVISLLVVARIGRRLFSPAVGGIAALLLALDGVAANSAPLCGNESLTVLLGLLAFSVAIEGDSLRRRIAVGLLIGLATATKYSAGILVVPLVVAYGLRVGPAIVAAAAGLAAGAPMALVNFREFLHDFTLQAGFLRAGYSAEDVAHPELGFGFYVRTFAGSHAGLAAAILCGAGILASIAVAAVRRERAHLLLLSASLPLYLYLGTGIFCFERFLLPAVPFILIHGAWLLARLLDRVPLLRARPISGFAVGLLAVLGAAAPAAVRQHDALRRRFGAPEPPAALLDAVRPQLETDRRVAELAIPSTFRLLLPSDPWAELGLPPPGDAIRADVNDQLAAAALLPRSLLLNRAVVESPTLERLQQLLRDSGIDTVLLVVQSAQLAAGHGIHPTPQDANLRACPYWNELFDWLATLPRIAFARSPDLRITAAMLDLRESAR